VLIRTRGEVEQQVIRAAEWAQKSTAAPKDSTDDNYRRIKKPPPTTSGSAWARTTNTQDGEKVFRVPSRLFNQNRLRAN